MRPTGSVPTLGACCKGTCGVGGVGKMYMLVLLSGHNVSVDVEAFLH